ncbi:uncharacterized protein LOC118362846 isoform X2 [Oncorhynchus keta]|uniref:uncharacterized protein LOC118362846 isoform X2 n=1 Tax=Oncorhynchus keta TaxID=8018 RepID=UPI0015F7D427|nr:uncharacterized protein LOC118362846 isoform X2 [Oncorhynchus keta]XP_052342479.1 uncharacterized protein LOC118362846 isoform X2 [Oncorhynchus keta]
MSNDESGWNSTGQDREPLQFCSWGRLNLRSSGRIAASATTRKQKQMRSANNLQDGETPDAKLLQKNGQMSGLSEKAAGKIEVVNALCEDRVVADVGETNSVIISQNKDILETIATLTEKIPPLENVMGRNHQMQTMRHQQMRLKQKLN